MNTEGIKLAYEHWKIAMIEGDLDSLDKICAENFLWTNYMGVTCNKSENLNKIRSGKVRYISWINEDLSIDMEGNDMYVVKTRAIRKMIVFDLKVTAVQDITIIFINVNGNWLLACGQETIVDT